MLHLIFAALVMCPVLSAAEHYMTYFVLSPRNNLTGIKSHVFEIVVKAEGPEINSRIIETATINWGPRGNPLVVFSQKGKNSHPSETLINAVNKDRVINQLGFFRISERLYNETVTWARSLDTAALKYKVLDGRSKRNGKAFNCIAASAHRQIVTGSHTGLEAASIVLSTFERDFLNYQAGTYHETHDWVSSAIGLDPFRAQITPTHFKRTR